MNIILIAFVAGVMLFQLMPVLPASYWLLGALALPFCWRWTKLRPVAAMLGGFFWVFAYAAVQLSASLPIELEGRDLILTGTIASIPTIKQRITRFELAVGKVQLQGQEVKGPDLIRLNWYDLSHALEPGQTWRLKVRLKRPRGFQNPAGFDYERWLFSHGIGATGYVRQWEGNARLGEGYQGGGLNRLRQRISAQMALNIDDPPSAALLRALAIGDRSGLSSEQWELFSKTGTNHLVAISGLHIGMVAGLVFFLGQWLWRQSEWLTLRLAALRAGAWLALISATVYAALAGFSLPTQRALIMLSLGLGALLIGRSLSLDRSFSLALFGVVLIDPMAPLSPGFWLSFGAVAVILFSLGGRNARPRGWREWGRVQWVVALGLAPLLFFLFGRASLIAPLVNLLLVPWFSLVLVPAVLIGVPLLKLPLLAGPWMDLTQVLAQITLHLLSWSAQLPYAMVRLPALSEWVWFAGLLGVLLLLLPRGIPGRPLGVLLVAPMLLQQPARMPPGSLHFSLLDVGQGLSSVIETAGHVLVYDTGPSFASGFNAAESALIPYLRSRGIDLVDLLIVSNGDRDHAGGVEALRNNLQIGQILSGEPAALENARACRAGMRWDWDGVAFEMLHPDHGDNYTQTNDRSCVLKVSAKGGTLLLPGDVQRIAEERLVRVYGEALRADILVAPHHGSNTSSTLAFVRRVDADYVLFATGYRNRFGFPKSEVVNRWRDAGAQLFDTAQTGAIEFRLLADKPLDGPNLYRVQHPHYWSSKHARDE